MFNPSVLHTSDMQKLKAAYDAFKTDFPSISGNPKTKTIKAMQGYRDVYDDYDYYDGDYYDDDYYDEEMYDEEELEGMLSDFVIHCVSHWLIRCELPTATMM